MSKGKYDVTVEPPLILGEHDRAEALRSYFRRYARYSISRLHTAKAENIAVAGPHLLAFSGNQLLKPSYRGAKGVRRARFIQHGPDGYSWDPKTVSETSFDRAITVGGKASGEFFHWMVEIVPRLTAIREKPNVSKFNLVMRPLLKGFQKQTIESLGLAPDEVTEDVIHVGVWRQPTHMINWSGKGAISPDAVTLLNHFADRYLGVTARPKRRIYVSRADAPKRKIANEDEVLALLSRYGFEEVRLSEHPLAQQAQLFRNAEAVVGLHGAGLTSAAFGGPDLKLIELYPEGFVAVSPFRNLANLSRQAYAMVLCQSVIESAKGHHNSDVLVDLGLLRSAIIEMGLS